MGGGGYAAFMGEMRNEYKILALKLERKRRHRKFRRKWEDNIKLDCKTTCEDVD
jgi:hypothetical protein